MAYRVKRNFGYDFSTYLELFRIYSRHFGMSKRALRSAIQELIAQSEDPAETDGLRQAIGLPGIVVPGVARGSGFARRKATYETLLHSLAVLAATWKPAEADLVACREAGRMFDLLMASDNWRGRPMLALTKVVETSLFRLRAPLMKPAMEIGFQAGRHSRLLFKPGAIDIGFDLSPAALLEAKCHDAAPFLISGDVYALPLPADCLNTVFMVHSIDDCQRGAAPALAEIARVLAPGGRTALSGFTDRFRDSSLATRLDATGARFGRWHKGIESFFDGGQWQDLVRQAGLEVEYYAEFLPDWMVPLLEPALSLEKWLLNRAGISKPAGETLAPGLHRGLRRLAQATWIGSVGGRGAEFFMIARKPGSAAPQPLVLACPVCPERPRLEGLAGREATLACPRCGTLYPLSAGIPILHPEMRLFQERWPTGPEVSV